MSATLPPMRASPSGSRPSQRAGRSGPVGYGGGGLAAAFDAAPVARVSKWLAALDALGQARVGNNGKYATA